MRPLNARIKSTSLNFLRSRAGWASRKLCRRVALDRAAAIYEVGYSLRWRNLQIYSLQTCFLRYETICWHMVPCQKMTINQLGQEYSSRGQSMLICLGKE